MEIQDPLLVYRDCNGFPVFRPSRYCMYDFDHLLVAAQLTHGPGHHDNWCQIGLPRKIRIWGPCASLNRFEIDGRKLLKSRAWLTGHGTASSSVYDLLLALSTLTY